MARPKKIVVSNATAVEQTANEAPPLSTNPSVFTNEAISVAQGKDGRWGLVKIPYNYLTGEVGTIEFEPVGNSKMDASYRFKIYGYAGPEGGSKHGPILA